MKTPALGLVVLTLMVASASACTRPQKRTDWRSPSPITPCTSDTECSGGRCAIEIGATQGSCGPASGSLPVLPGVDGGGAPSGPGAPAPVIQPSSSDIQI